MASTTELYRATRERMCALALSADGDSPVPACPGWSVRDLFAHVAGVAADVVAGNIGGAGTDPWTAMQVESRRARALDEVVAEWRDVGPQVEEALEPFGGVPGQMLFDTVSHEHDLRHALGVHGDLDDESIAAALAWASERWQGLESSAGVCLDVAGEHLQHGDRDPAVTIALTPFEALRALTGRRSPSQLAAYDASGSVEPWLGAFTWGPFAPAAEPIDEG